MALFVAWPMWLVMSTNRNLQRVDALSAAPNTAGKTYLLAGSDARAEGEDGDEIDGQRADSIVLIHVARNRQAAMVSLPRDLYVDIPGYGHSKINAAFSLGGPALLVETVEQLTGLTVDHYAQIDMQGFGPLVDAVGGVNLCLDYDVEDELSGLNWQAGCHEADGATALAFARMRYSDPMGDLGRAERQRQVISAVTKQALSPATLLNPFQQQRLSKTGTETLTVDESASVFDIGKMLLAFRKAGKNGLTGTPPLWGIDEYEGVGSVVLLDEDLAPEFFDKLARGKLVPADFDLDL